MIRAFQWDLARQVERLDWLLDQLPRYADWGYQELYLHLEDAVDYPGLPGVARADAYSWDEFERLVAAASRHGIGVVPIVNLLGHTQYLIKCPAWRDLNELRHADGTPQERGQICPLHPRTAEVATRLLTDVAPYCTTGKVHVGLDESFHLGRHPLSRAEIADIGLSGHFAGHVRRLHALAGQQRLRLGLWADMLAFLPEAISLLPPDVVAYDWYYHAFRRHPRVELFNFAECDLATPLRARGIEYWGCPMSSGFRFEPLPVFGERLANAASWWRRCQHVGAGGFLVTAWEPDRLAIESTTVVDAAIASLWLNPGVDDHAAQLEHGVRRVFPSAAARPAARAALAADAYAYAGYARWETQGRWTVTPTTAGARPAEQEARAHRRLVRHPGLPPPLRDSLEFRRYLAERDAFITRAAKGVFALRRRVARGVSAGAWSSDRGLVQLTADAAAFAPHLRMGARAARAMWRRTRSARVVGPNERQIAADRERWREWRRWLARCRKQPGYVWSASPMAGRWQLQLTVINFAPAVQRVVVEQLQAEGRWEERVGRHTIEFRTAAARPRARVQRSLVVPLDDPRRPLRIAIEGVGEVAVAQVELTNGITVLRPLGWKRAERRRIGQPAPARGWPLFHERSGQTQVDLHFPDDPATVGERV